MAGILNEYLNKRWSILDLQNELQRLIKDYNSYTGRYLFIYAVDISKAKMGVNDIDLQQDDFYNIQDILRECSASEIDFYIETPGGNGTTAEEIARFLRKRFKTVNFVIAGEAKSAGTILVLSGDNIYMTETGSLGPIDAQVKIGRYIVSAHDYKAWIEEKKEEASQTGRLNPLDAIVVSQISPGEIYGVINSLEYAKDLVKKWLCEYKFKNWSETETRKIKVTSEMKKERASHVAEYLCNHMAWRTHGRSLKIEDLQDLIKIERIDDDKRLSDIVYRIKTVLRLIMGNSTTSKIYRTEDTFLGKTATIAPNNVMPTPIPIPNSHKQQEIKTVQLNIVCPKCNKTHQINGYLDIDSKTISTLKLPTNPNVGDNDVLTCDNCKFELDLKPIKNEIESKEHKKISFK